MTDVFIKEVPRMMIFSSLKAMLKQKRQMGKDFPKSIDEEFAESVAKINAAVEANGEYYIHTYNRSDPTG